MTEIRARMLCAIIVAMTGMTPVFAQQSTPLGAAEEAADEEAGRRAAIAALRDDTQSDPNTGSLGDPEGDTVIVEFFDYNGPCCKPAAPAVAAHIARSRELATQLGITGTPTFIIGDGLVPGFAEKAQLAAAIAEARDSAGEP